MNGEAGMDKEMFIQEIGFKSATGSTVVSFVGVLKYQCAVQEVEFE